MIPSALTSTVNSHQPPWQDHPQLDLVRNVLETTTVIASPVETDQLARRLRAVEAGHASVLQMGDCAEDPAHCTPAHVHRKLDQLTASAGAVATPTGLPVVQVGRIAGQFAKPRSKATETVGDREVVTYRGHMVNLPDSDEVSRTPDPLRILMGYLTSRQVAATIAGFNRGRVLEDRVWTSHEALLLDYEHPMMRSGSDERTYLTSAHWPWIGERTRNVDGAHVATLAHIANPSACKVGPTATEGDLVALCSRLDPYREPGKLALITRMGAQHIRTRLPALMSAVRAAGHRVLWICDPMHGNTLSAGDGTKTRVVDDVIDEMTGFVGVADQTGTRVHGLHLETTHLADVSECVWSSADLASARPSSPLCDPRLNPEQTAAVVHAWGEMLARHYRAVETPS